MIKNQIIEVDENGEIVSAKVNIIKKCKPEEFCQVYLENNPDLFGLTQSEYTVLAYCWKEASYYKAGDIANKFIANKTFKENLQKVSDLKDSTIKNALTSLSKKGMIIKNTNCRGEYFLNPKYFFKGVLSDRLKSVEVITEYQINLH